MFLNTSSTKYTFFFLTIRTRSKNSEQNCLKVHLLTTQSMTKSKNEHLTVILLQLLGLFDIDVVLWVRRICGVKSISTAKMFSVSFG